MEKDYPPADQYPPVQPTDGAYPPPYPPGPYPTDQYPYPPSAPYPAAYPTQAQPPPYEPGAVQQQQQTNTVVVAAAPQPAANVVHGVVKPPNYIALSLINLLCCCWVMGIVGLIYSLKVDSEFNAGRYEEARRASESARNVNYVGIGIGTFLIIGYIIISIVVNVVVAAANSSSNDDY